MNPLKSQTCETVIYSNNTNVNAAKGALKATGDEEQTSAGLLRFNIPEHTPIIFSEIAGRTLERIEVKDLSKESEQDKISAVMPLWIIDAIVNVSLFRPTLTLLKILFHINSFLEKYSQVQSSNIYVESL